MRGRGGAVPRLAGGRHAGPRGRVRPPHPGRLQQPLRPRGHHEGELRCRSVGFQLVYFKDVFRDLPSDIHDRVQDRLFVSMTSLRLRNVLVSRFHDPDDLRAALTASCFLPLFSGNKVPAFRGQRFLDGGLTNQLPTLDQGGHTFTLELTVHSARITNTIFTFLIQDTSNAVSCDKLSVGSPLTLYKITNTHDYIICCKKYDI